MNQTTAIILAAGASSRMGRPKALIEHHGVPWVKHMARTYGRVGCRVVVVWGAHPEVAAAVPGLGVQAVDWRAGMRASLRAGVRAAPGPYLITPVDCPFVSARTIGALVACRGAVVPTYQGSLGHPLRLPAGLRGRLLRNDAAPLRTLFSPRSLPVDDPEVLRNLNRPADLEAVTQALADDGNSRP